ADAAERRQRGAVRLVERRLVDERERSVRGHAAKSLGVAQGRVARLDDAGAGDERERRAAADRDGSDSRSAGVHYRFTTFRPPRTGAPRGAAGCGSAGRMNPLNSGWQWGGRDLNSGWNWVPRNQGWSPSSIIPTSPPSGDTPEHTRPADSSCSRYASLNSYRCRWRSELLCFL